MKKEDALRVIDSYNTEKREAEKSRNGLLWLNPVELTACNGQYNKTIDGKGYHLSVIGYDGWEPLGFEVVSEETKTRVYVPCENL